MFHRYTVGLWALAITAACHATTQATQVPAPKQARTLEVLGEPDTNTVLPIRYGLAYPDAVFSAQGKLILTDTDNNRVLIWDAVPQAPTTLPDIVLGQPNLDTLTSGGLFATDRGDNTLTVWSDGQRLAVASSVQNRVLVWNTFPTVNNQPPDFALGQPADDNNLTTVTNNTGGISGCSLNAPRGVASDGNRLFVADSDNGRILVWNTLPTRSGQCADFALGVPEDGNNLLRPSPQSVGLTIQPTASSLNLPTALTVDGNHLFVFDALNDRLLVWNSLPTQGGQPADLVLGTSSFTGIGRPPYVPEGYTPANGSTFDFVTGITVIHGKLYISDDGSLRILVWNNLPVTNGASADFAIGSPDEANSLTAWNYDEDVSASLLSRPGGLANDGQRLIAVDTASSRALIWNHAPTSPDEVSDTVLGRGIIGANDFTSLGANLVDPNHFFPTSIASDANRLVVMDYERVLIWNNVSPLRPASETNATWCAMSVANGNEPQTLRRNRHANSLLGATPWRGVSRRGARDH